MEELLNKLIKKGRVPFGLKGVDKAEYGEQYFRNYNWNFWGEGWSKRKSIRDIVSKESGLWQFVCENGMVVRKRQGTNRGGGEPEKCFDYKDYEYRLIESALCNEEDLEKFLIENIKIS